MVPSTHELAASANPRPPPAQTQLRGLPPGGTRGPALPALSRGLPGLAPPRRSRARPGASRRAAAPPRRRLTAMEEPRPPRPPLPPLLPVPGAGGRLPGGAAAGGGRLGSALPPVGGAEGEPALRPARRLTGVDLAATCLSVRSFPFFFFGNCFPQLHKKSGFLPAGSPRGSGDNGSSPLRGEGARGARSLLRWLLRGGGSWRARHLRN